jgi:Cytochrome C'
VATANLDPDIFPLHLTDGEKDALVRFLECLDGRVEPVVAPRLPRVVTKPSTHSTRALMTSVDGMLDRLDRLIGSLDGEQWTEVRTGVDRLSANTEELAALRRNLVPPRRRTELKEQIGALAADFRELAAAADHRDHQAAHQAYETVRNDCDSCHQAFRPEVRR